MTEQENNPLERFYQKHKNDSSKNGKEEDLAEVLAKEVVTVANRNFLREKMAQSHKKTLKKRFIKRVAWSAIVLFFVATLFYFFNKDRTLNDEKVYAEFFEPYPNLLTTRSTPDNTQGGEVMMAMDAYDRGDYREAASFFATYFDQEKSEPGDLITFYYSLCLIATKNLPLAEKLLTHLSNNEGFVLHRETLWYLAITHLNDHHGKEALNDLHFLQQKYPEFKKEEILTLVEQLE